MDGWVRRTIMNTGRKKTEMNDMNCVLLDSDGEKRRKMNEESVVNNEVEFN